MDSTGSTPGSGDNPDETPNTRDNRPDDLIDQPTSVNPAASLGKTQPAASVPDEVESRGGLADIPTQANVFGARYGQDGQDGHDSPGPNDYDDSGDDEWRYPQGGVADWDTGEQRAPRYYIASPASPRGMQFSRRRRRYIFYMRHSVRARQAARSNNLIRLAWASAIVTGALILSIFAASVGVAASYYQSQQAVIGSLNRTVSSHDSVRIYDSKSVLLYQFSDFGAQHSITLAHVPLAVVNATVAIEDRSFWVNQGIDFTSIVRAAIECKCTVKRAGLHV